MKYYYPEYYKQFNCIAALCKHSCCVGWEIDIDEDTMELYNQLGNDITKHIETDVDGPHFMLTDEERCPFLQSNGLCKIICDYGEDMLCDICSDHPRFRNYYSDRVEIGLGLCCESACKLILDGLTPFHLVCDYDDNYDDISDEEELGFIDFRNKSIEILNSNFCDPTQNILDFLRFCDVEFHDLAYNRVYEILSNMEILNPMWLNYLKNLKNNSKKLTETDLSCFSVQYTNLLAYFVYRNLYYGFEEKNIPGYAYFCVFSTYAIAAIFNSMESKTLDTLYEVARMYSSEIEYSEDNRLALSTLQSQGETQL